MAQSRPGVAMTPFLSIPTYIHDCACGVNMIYVYAVPRPYIREAHFLFVYSILAGTVHSLMYC